MRSEGFNRINLDRTIPTKSSGEARITTFLFQSYQSRQGSAGSRRCHAKGFQSYQSRQINPDVAIDKLNNLISAVSIVSIQTDQSRLDIPLSPVISVESFQSYQSKQINPDLVTPTTAVLPVCRFNRINLDRSIPTWSHQLQRCYRSAVSIVSIQTDQSRLLDALRDKKLGKGFQSYQSRQMNHDFVDFGAEYCS